MPLLKTRKQFRLEAEAASNALKSLDTPEGLAGFLFEKFKDPEFRTKFSEHYDNLQDQTPEIEKPETDSSASTEPLTNQGQ